MMTRSLIASVCLMGVVSFAACDGANDDPGRESAGSAGKSAPGGETSVGGRPATTSGGMPATDSAGASGQAGSVTADGPCELTDGQCIFRNDTFGDEQLWTDTLRLHEVVQLLSPTDALKLGLKVDMEAVPADVLAGADLEAPETTVALLELGAVVGIRASVADGMITEIGITCALCHSTVDDSAAPGIGKRLDGWPNRDLNPGAIIAATPGLPALASALGVTTAAARTALESWGPGRYDARFNQDGESHPVLIPPAYGLADVELETYTGEGPISYWNAYVAITQMGGQGNFKDEALGLDLLADPDQVTPKLPALRDYQFSLLAPSPAASSFDAASAARGAALFAGDAKCVTCHAGESFTDSPILHEPAETGMEENEARRSTTGKYRTTPLRGVSTHPPFFHDGSAPTLANVVAHYDTALQLGLSAKNQADLVEYLKSL